MQSPIGTGIAFSMCFSINTGCASAINHLRYNLSKIYIANYLNDEYAVSTVLKSNTNLFWSPELAIAVNM